MIEVFSAIGELFYRLFQGLAAWKYLASSEFRTATRQRWLHERRIVVVEEIVGGVMGIMITIAASGLIVYFVFF